MYANLKSANQDLRFNNNTSVKTLKISQSLLIDTLRTLVFIALYIAMTAVLVLTYLEDSPQFWILLKAFFILVIVGLVGIKFRKQFKKS